MEQYEKSGPAPDTEKPYDRREVDFRVETLQDTCARQELMIRDLQKELQRIKSKLDAHAIVINRLKNNG
jgi:hypothetical protein